MSKLLSFDDTLHQKKRPQDQSVPVAASSLSQGPNPYVNSASPRDIHDYLLPDGSRFSMYADPYATMFFDKPKLGLSNGKFWVDERLEDGNFSPNEIKLLTLLSNMRLATRNQIHKTAFREIEDHRTVVEFLLKMRKVGVICAFSWVSPLKDEAKKPFIYGLTKAGAQAAGVVLQRQLPESLWFQPIEYEFGQGPNMNERGFFLDLVAHELYSELVRVDRLISWHRTPRVRMPNGTKDFSPCASFVAIKDKNEFRSFWVEIFRPIKGWQETTISRFQKLQAACLHQSPTQRPDRIIIVADGDSRVPFLTQMALQHMPDIVDDVKFTTDERLLKGLDKNTFVSWDHANQELVSSTIPFLLPDYHGMTASEYVSEQKAGFDIDADYEE